VICAHLTTETSVIHIPINNNINTKTHHHVNVIVEVALDAILTVFFIDKKAVIIINKNKKFINESFSFQPKYIENKFLNFTLTFHHINTTKESNMINIVQRYSQLQKIQKLFDAADPLKDVTLITGVNNKNTTNTNK
jgi:hypothetical protein